MFTGGTREHVGAAAKRREKMSFAEAPVGEARLRDVENPVELNRERLAVDERRPFAADHEAPQLRRAVAVSVENGVVLEKLCKLVDALREPGVERGGGKRLADGLLAVGKLVISAEPAVLTVTRK